jgi:hypothetical protein
MSNTDFQIKCPICSWNHDGRENWRCTCGHTWNTFQTYGTCPKCNKRWEDTQCPTVICRKWSKHEDWYIIPIDIRGLLKIQLHDYS